MCWRTAAASLSQLVQAQRFNLSELETKLTAVQAQIADAEAKRASAEKAGKQAIADAESRSAEILSVAQTQAAGIIAAAKKLSGSIAVALMSKEPSSRPAVRSAA
jgi:hypothetical protein